MPSLERMTALLKSDAEQVQASLLEWSEPVVFDCLRECYCKRVDPVRAGELAHRHSRQWRALIAGEMTRFRDLRRGLIGALADLDLDVAGMVEGDVSVLAELYEIAMARFGRSPRQANAYRVALRAIAAELASMSGARAAA